MILTMILILFVIILYIFTETMLPYPKSSPNITNETYAPQKDLWFKKNKNKLFIFLHGISADPNEFGELGETITDYDVYIPVLPSAQRLPSGHSPYQWEDSLKVVLYKILANSSNYKEIVLCGHSQGGDFAMTLAPSLGFVNKLIIIASPINLLNKKYTFMQNFLIWCAGFTHFLPNKGLHIAENNELLYGLAIHSFRHGLIMLRKTLKNIYTPTYLIYHTKDPIAPLNNLEYLKKKLPNIKDILILDEDESADIQKHKIFNNPYVKDLVIEKIQEYLKT